MGDRLIDERFYIKDNRIKDVCGMYEFDECENLDCACEMCRILNVYHQGIEESDCLISALKDEVRDLKLDVKQLTVQRDDLQQSKIIQEYDNWINGIMQYVDVDKQFIIKLALSFTLQSLRNGEDLTKFKWEDC